MTDDIPELSPGDFTRAISVGTRRRLGEGRITCGEDIMTIRAFVGLNVEEFAEATGATADAVREWESGKRPLDGPTVRLLRIAVRHPGVFLESLRSTV